MQRVTPHVFTSTEIRGCNPSYVVTSAGVVVIDTPQLPTKAVAMRRAAEEHGPIRYVVNTEHHVDHIFGNYWFKGAGEVVHHRGVADNFMVPTPDLDPFAYALEAIPTDDPDAADIVPDRDTYYEDPNAGDLVFTGDLEMKVGEKTFHLIHTPGHTPGQVAVYVPDERVVFTGDTVFSECQTWLMTSDIDQWVGALDLIAGLDVDTVVPGHGPVTTPGVPGHPAVGAARVDQRRRRGRGQGLVARGDHRAGRLPRQVRPGRRRAGLHDGPHPDAQRGLAVGQVHRQARPRPLTTSPPRSRRFPHAMNQAAIDELQRFTLADRVAVVAGGSGGVGVRTCGALAAVGAKVAIIGRSEERLAEARKAVENAGGEALVIAGDMADKAAADGRDPADAGRLRPGRRPGQRHRRRRRHRPLPGRGVPAGRSGTGSSTST